MLIVRKEQRQSRRAGRCRVRLRRGWERGRGCATLAWSDIRRASREQTAWVLAGSDSLGGRFPDPKSIVKYLPPATMIYRYVG